MLHDMYSYIHLHSQVRTLTHAQFTCPHSCCLVKFCSRPTATLSSSRQFGKARSALTDLCVQRHSSRPGCFAFFRLQSQFAFFEILGIYATSTGPTLLCKHIKHRRTSHFVTHTHQALDVLCCRLQCHTHTHTHTHTHGCTFIHKGPTRSPFKCDPCTWAWA